MLCMCYECFLKDISQTFPIGDKNSAAFTGEHHNSKKSYILNGGPAWAQAAFAPECWCTTFLETAHAKKF